MICRISIKDYIQNFHGVLKIPDEIVKIAYDKWNKYDPSLNDICKIYTEKFDNNYNFNDQIAWCDLPLTLYEFLIISKMKEINLNDMKDLSAISIIIFLYVLTLQDINNYVISDIEILKVSNNDVEFRISSQKRWIETENQSIKIKIIK